jgi:hypothetical protein
MAGTGRELAYEDESGVVYWDDEAQCVELETKHYVSSDAFRSALEQLLVVIEERKARKFLVDMSGMDRIGDGDLLWSETDWFPRCLQAGVVFVAMVMPESAAPLAMVDEAADRISTYAMSEYVRRFFNDVEDAREWLAHQ